MVTAANLLARTLVEAGLKRILESLAVPRLKTIESLKGEIAVFRIALTQKPQISREPFGQQTLARVTTAFIVEFLAEVVGECAVGEHDFHASISERKGIDHKPDRLLTRSKEPGINAGLPRRHKLPGTVHVFSLVTRPRASD